MTKTEDELLKKISEHASKAYNMKTISPYMMAKIKRAIKKWPCPRLSRVPPFFFLVSKELGVLSSI
jgi:hypothetical protein